MLKTMASRFTALLLGAGLIGSAYAASISHDRLYSVDSGQRIEIAAAISDESAIEVARVYFKAQAGANFNFVKMSPAGSGRYVATLPAPSKGAGQIEYTILAKSVGSPKPFRSPSYQVLVNDTALEVSMEQEQIDVYSELDSAPESVEGFTDNLALDTVESGARYAAAAGIGEAGTGVASSAVEAAEAAASTSTTSTSGSNAGAITAIVIGGAAAVGAVAYGVSELDSDDDYDGSSGGCVGQSFGFEAVSSSGGFTARASWFIDSDGDLITAQWDSDGLSDSCTVSGSAGTLPCSDIQDQLNSQCDAYAGTGVTCSTISSKPFYMTCG